MLATVLRSETAVEISKLIVNTFDEIHIILQENKDLKKRIEKLEKEAAQKNEVVKALYLLSDKDSKKGS